MEGVDMEIQFFKLLFVFLFCFQFVKCGPDSKRSKNGCQICGRKQPEKFFNISRDQGAKLAILGTFSLKVICEEGEICKSCRRAVIKFKSTGKKHTLVSIPYNNYIGLLKNISQFFLGQCQSGLKVCLL